MFYTENESVSFCKDVCGLMNELTLQYEPKEWRLFIDSSKSGLKAVLLHNGNVFPSIHRAHSIHLKKTYKDLLVILQNLKYDDHGCMICLKVISTLLGQQLGYTKYPCFLRMWDSRARHLHWTKSMWPLRYALTPGSSNINYKSLVTRGKILLPPLHIKFGLMKQFCKLLRRDGDCWKMLLSKFPNMSEGKLKEGIFVGPDIRKLMADALFSKSMNVTDKEVWDSFADVVHNFLGNKKMTITRRLWNAC